MTAPIGLDFGLGDEQTELVALAGQVFGDLATTGRLAEIERTGDRFDGRLWRALAGAGLLGLGIDPEWGGSGGGLVEVALLLEQQGRAVAPVPLAPTLMLGAYPVQRYATDDLRRRWLPEVAGGRQVLTGAYYGIDPVRGTGPARAHVSGGSLRLNGRLVAVPAAHLAARVIVPVRSGAQWWLALVDPSATGVTVERAVTTDRSIAAHLDLHEVEVDERIAVTAAELADVLDCARIAWCAVQTGVVGAALDRTAAHVSQRRQFGRELGTFQAVTQRIADFYVDAEALRWTVRYAAWVLAARGPARADVAVAAWWAARSGHRGLHAALHLHGGLGNDIEYPLHRYFLWARQIALMVGGAGRTLAELGDLVPEIVDSPTGAA